MVVTGTAPLDLTATIPPVRLLTAADLDGVAEELAAYHAHFAPLFQRREQRAWAAVYLRGLLTADVPRKNVEALALRLLGAGPGADRRVRAMQQCGGGGGWDDAGILAAHQRLVEETLGEADGVLIIDGHETPKQGTHSVGVARQWCGHTGKKDNCQAGVHLGYASRRGYTLLGRRHPARHPVPDQARAGRRAGRGGGGESPGAGALGRLRRGLRRQPGAAGPLGGAGLVVSGRGGACYPGLVPDRAGRADGAGTPAALGATAERRGQRAGADEGTPPPGEPCPAARGGVGSGSAGRALAAVSAAGGEQGAAGRRVRGGAGGRRARPPARPRRLAAGAPDRAGRGRGGRVQVLPEH